VRVKINLSGSPKWLTRTINSQNGFNSMNMLNVHFGLGNANIIDSLEIYWQSGLKQTFTNITPDKFYTITEGQSPVVNIKSQGSNVPNNFELFQNFPNPFNPKTKISFQINKNSVISLEIFDSMGRKIETLLKSDLAYGFYEVSWDAEKYPSGVYYYSIRSEDFSQTNKMVLVK